MPVRSFFDKITNLFGGTSSSTNIALTSDNLGAYLKNNPNILKNKEKLKATLKDAYQGNIQKVNLLMMGYEEKIIDIANKPIDDNTLSKFENRLTNNWSIRGEDARWIIQTWLGDILKSIEMLPNNSVDGVITSKSQLTEYSESLTDNQASGTFSQVVSSIVPVLVAMQGGQNENKISRDELIEIYSHTFDQNNPKKNMWEYVDYCGDRVYKDFNANTKKMLLRMICKNKFTEADVVHACIQDDLSTGFILTTSAVCLYDNEGFDNNINEPCAIIYYNDIANVTTYGYSLVINIKNGESLSVKGHRIHWGCWDDNTVRLGSYLNAVAQL